MKSAIILRPLLCTALLLSLATSCGKDSNVADKGDHGNNTDQVEKFEWGKAADNTTGKLISLYWGSSQQYFLGNNIGNEKFQYWPQAHALDVIIDAYLRTGESRYKDIMDQWIVGVRKGNGDKWKNNFYDDMEWIALACERAWHATGDDKWIDVATSLWKEIKGAWNEDYADGGMAWKTDKAYSKNACSNGPAAILAARLYKDTKDEECLEYAEKIFAWEKSHLVRNNLVIDHIDGMTGEVKEWKFTYNQGTYIGAAVELYSITKDKGYLDEAVNVADATISNLASGSVLKLEGDPDSSKDNDAHLFKGIFIRYLNQLVLSDISAAKQKQYVRFIEHNARTLYEKGLDSIYFLCGPDWSVKPGGVVSLKSNVSGCMLIEGTAFLQNEKLL